MSIISNIADTSGTTKREEGEPVWFDADLGYKIKKTALSNGKGYWNSNRCEIYNSENIKLGEYIYLYCSMNKELFMPFEQDGKHYALYSEDYTVVSIMELPSCKKIASDSAGFCPVHFYVPEQAKGKFGFVAGCYWGDDSSWKIRFLDLSQITSGIIKNEDRFGYIQMPNDINSLKDAFNFDFYEDEHQWFSIKHESSFRLDRDYSEYNFSSPDSKQKKEEG